MHEYFSTPESRFEVLNRKARSNNQVTTYLKYGKVGHDCAESRYQTKLSKIYTFPMMCMRPLVMQKEKARTMIQIL